MGVTKPGPPTALLQLGTTLNCATWYRPAVGPVLPVSGSSARGRASAPCCSASALPSGGAGSRRRSLARGIPAGNEGPGSAVAGSWPRGSPPPAAPRLGQKIPHHTRIKHPESTARSQRINGDVARCMKVVGWASFNKPITFFFKYWAGR